MRKKLKRRKAIRAKSKLGLPDLEQAKSAVLVSLRSPESQRVHRRHSFDHYMLFTVDDKQRINAPPAL